MNYENFITLIRCDYGKRCSAIVTSLFEAAVEFAEKGELETAMKIASDAIVLMKYSDIGYESIYLLGFFCQLCIDTQKYEMANRFFLYGMKLIEEAKKNKAVDIREYQNDIDNFLDLKLKLTEATGMK